MEILAFVKKIFLKKPTERLKQGKGKPICQNCHIESDLFILESFPYTFRVVCSLCSVEFWILENGPYQRDKIEYH